MYVTVYVCRYVVEVTEPDVLVALRNVEAAEARVNKVMQLAMMVRNTSVDEGTDLSLYSALTPPHSCTSSPPLFFLTLPYPYTRWYLAWWT